MKLYTITVEGQVAQWAGTQADAKDAKREQQAQHPRDTVTWQEREVPTDKSGLLTFLNTHCITLLGSDAEAPTGE